MSQHKRQLSRNNSFNMTTGVPSRVLEGIKKDWGYALDLWCGKFRNSIFLATQWYKVIAVDVADLSSTYQLIPKEIRKNIKYILQDLDTYRIEGVFDVIVAARLFQYLSYTTVMTMIADAYTSLKKLWKLYISLNTEGGIFNQNQIDVPKYKHSIKRLVSDIQKIGFSIELLEKGAPVNSWVNYQDAIVSYDIICVK